MHHQCLFLPSCFKATTKYIYQMTKSNLLFLHEQRYPAVLEAALKTLKVQTSFLR